MIDDDPMADPAKSADYQSSLMEKVRMEIVNDQRSRAEQERAALSEGNPPAIIGEIGFPGAVVKAS